MFTKGQFYHIYNEGNNNRQLFFSNHDYELFLYKVKSYLGPFSKVIAFCLLPNQFHFIMHIMRESLDRIKFKNEVQRIQKHYLKIRDLSWYDNPSRLNMSIRKEISIHDSMGIIQRSYTRALNHRKNWSGSLFRANYKREDVFLDELTNLQNEKLLDKLLYNDIILEYIHRLPINEKLCNRKEDWKYSSAREYAGLCKVNFCDLDFKNVTKVFNGKQRVPSMPK